MKVLAVGIQVDDAGKEYLVYAHRGGRRFVALRRRKGQVTYQELHADIQKVERDEPVARQ